MALYLPQNKSPEEVARFLASLKEHDAKFAEIEKRGYVTAMPEIFRRDIFAPKTRQPTAEEDALLAQRIAKALNIPVKTILDNESETRKMEVEG